MKLLSYLWIRRRVLVRAIWNLLLWLAGEPARRLRSRRGPARPAAVFIQRNARARVRNLAIGLQEEGWKTILVTQVFEYRFQREVFDEIHLWLSRRGLRRLLDRLERREELRAVVGSLQPASVTAELLGMERRARLLVFNQDSAWSRAHFRRMDLRETRKVSSWLSAEEVEAEKRCFLGVDGVLASSREIEVLFQENDVRTPLLIAEESSSRRSFQPLELSGRPRDGEWSVAYAGMIYPMSSDPRYYSSGQFVPYGPSFAKERIHLHLYPSPHHEYDYPEYQEEERRNPYFHLHPSAGNGEVQRVLSRYDFGLVGFDCRDCLLLSEMHLRYHVQSKFNTYLEAGLPIIVPRCFEREAEIVESTGAGLVLEGKGVEGLRRRLEECDLAELRRRVGAAREGLSAESRGRALVEFIEGLPKRHQPVRERQAALVT